MGMEYKGYKYNNWQDFEEDNIKTFHDVTTPDGQEVSMDWSPYSTPSFEDFCAWIDLGMPKRQGCGPLSREDLIRLAKQQSRLNVRE